MKILIRATNWVGDAIMALPALRAVRKVFPDANISILARPYVAELYGSQGIADTLIPYDIHGAHEGFRGRAQRSEEHTSELQSQSNLVCRLLLEKKTRGMCQHGRRAAPLDDRLSRGA